MRFSLPSLVLVALCGASSSPPHIVHLLLDDFGWGSVNWHATDAEQAREIQTPEMDALRAAGLELDHFYAHKICSPSRCAIQSGRAPIHVNVQNVIPETRNPTDDLGGFQGVPLNMTLLPEHLKRAGYITRFVGKWDLGMATTAHGPRARGFDSSLHYWHHANDCESPPVLPAASLPGSFHATPLIDFLTGSL